MYLQIPGKRLLCSLICFVSLLTSSLVAQVLATGTEVNSHQQVLTVTGPGSFTFEETMEVLISSASEFEKFRTLYATESMSREVLTLDAEVCIVGSKKCKSAKRKHKAKFTPMTSNLADDIRVESLTTPSPDGFPVLLRTKKVWKEKGSAHYPLIELDYPRGTRLKELVLTIETNGFPILTRAFDPQGVFQREELGSAVRYSVKDWLSPKPESNAHPWYAYPRVALIPEEAKIFNSQLKANSWSGVAEWQKELLSTRSTLPEEAIAEVKSLVAHLESDREKVKALYAYMQKRSHYVSVQIGLGGWQPIDPAEVHGNGYGDCKGLSNYMRLLLEAADIPSSYLLIGVEDQEILFDDFPSLYQVNHAMLGVPLDKDTMYLECTSQMLPAGVVSSSSEGRKALWVSDNKMVRLPGNQPEQNRKLQRFRVELDEQGTGVLDWTKTLQGVAVGQTVSMKGLDTEEGRRHVIGELRVAQEGLQFGHAINDTDANISSSFRASAKLPNLSKKVGKRMLIPVSIAHFPDPEIRDSLDRKTPVYIERNIHRSDTLHYVLPKGYQLAKAPETTKLSAVHAEWNQVVSTLENGDVQIIHSIVQRRGIYPAEEAKAIAAFSRKLSVQAAQQLILEPQ